MSIRTVIELNHDYLNQIEREGLVSVLLAALKAADVERQREFLAARGIRILAQRHHSETLKLTVE